MKLNKYSIIWYKVFRNIKANKKRGFDWRPIGFSVSKNVKGYVLDRFFSLNTNLEATVVHHVRFFRKRGRKFPKLSFLSFFENIWHGARCSKTVVLLQNDAWYFYFKTNSPKICSHMTLKPCTRLLLGVNVLGHFWSKNLRELLKIGVFIQGKFDSFSEICLCTRYELTQFFLFCYFKNWKGEFRVVYQRCIVRIWGLFKK